MAAYRRVYDFKSYHLQAACLKTGIRPGQNGLIEYGTTYFN